MIRGQSAGGHDAVDMGMEQDVGTPGMQDGEEADLGAEALRSAATSSKAWELASNSRS
jgi:hypothetical protein